MDAFDKLERHRRVRRKAGSDQLGSQGDCASTSTPRRTGHIRSQTWSDSMNAASNDDAKASLLRNMQQLDLDNSGTRKRQLEEQRALWEASLPMPSPICVGQYLSEHV
jgi:hypothetical protein